jgi:DNA-binding response OmpR family regulator
VAKTPDQCDVLVVEDDPAIRRLVKMILEREHYHVEIVADGAEAMLKIGDRDYDVIILDLMMPNLDGFAFMNAIGEKDPERLKTVIVTSAASPTVIRERMHGVPFDILPKPFDIQKLAERVRSCITSNNGAPH